MNKVLAIIGAGHLGQQIANIAISDDHFSKVVFFDDFSSSSSIDQYKILGNTENIIPSYQKHLFDAIIIGIGYKHLKIRKELFEKLINKIPFATIVHSTCWVDETAVIKPGSILYPGCIVDMNCVISENCVINLGCVIAHDSVIGKHCFLSPRIAVAGFVQLGEQIFAGINSTVNDNIQIIDKVQLGGSTLVNKNIINPGLYVGTPAKKIK